MSGQGGPSGPGARSGDSSSGGGGFWPGLIGGVIGGAVAAFATVFLLMGGDADTTAALEDRLTAAEQQVGELDSLNGRIAALENQPAEAADGTSEFAARLEALETDLAALSQGAAEPSASGDGELDGRIAALQQQLDGLAGMEAKIESLGSEIQAASQAQQTNASALASLETVLPTLESTLTSTGQAVEQATAKTATLDQSIEALNGDIEALSTRVGDAEGRLDHIGGAYQRGAAMVVAIGDIDRAVSNSEPFDSALQSLKLLLRDESPVGESIAVLEPLAVDGVPSLTELKGDYGSMASRVLLAEEGDKTLADQVSNNVFGILNMRPSGGDVAGDNSRAVLARAQARLSDSDLVATIGELQALGDVASAEAAGWIERAQNRLSAEAAVVDLRAHAQTLVAQGS